MIKYFEEYSGGEDDIRETFAIFSDAVEKFIIPTLSFPEIEEIKELFEDDPAEFLELVEHTLFTSESEVIVGEIAKRLRALRDRLRAHADERGIILLLGRDGAEDARKANEGKDPLEYRVLNIMHVCAEKLAALLIYKRVQITLNQRKP